MKYLLAILILLFSFNINFAQTLTTQQPIKLITAPYKSEPLPVQPILDHSPIKTNETKPPEVIIKLTFDQLPDRLIISKPDDKDGAPVVEFSKLDLWRYLQYMYFLMPHINNAWDSDEKKDKK